MQRLARLRGPHALAFALIGLFLSGCGDSFKAEAKPSIEVNPTRVQFIVGNVKKGGTARQRVTIENTGNGALNVKDIVLNYNPVDASETPGNESISLQGLPPTPVDVAIKGSGGSDRISFEVVYRRIDDQPRQAQVTIVSNDKDRTKFVVDLVVIQGQPVLLVNPDTVSFKNVKALETQCQDVTLLNTGNANLIVDNVVLLGNDAFSTEVGGETFAVNEVVQFEGGLTVAPNQSFTLKVCFSPKDEQPASGELVVFASSDNAINGFKVAVQGNNAGPCIQVKPGKVNFGAKLKGGTLSQIEVEVSSCGKEQLEVLSVRMSTADDAKDPTLEALGVEGESSPQLLLDFSGAQKIQQAPSAENPWVLPVNSADKMAVEYTTPNESSPKDPQGFPVPDRGWIIFQTNAFREYVAVEVTGFSVDVLCPTAVIEITEGTSVVPQTTLHLDGTSSIPAAGGQVTEWFWSVTQPEKSKSSFLPNDRFATPVFEVNAAGEYTFQLVVRDSIGQESCEPARKVVTVVPDEAIHVELLWHTPGDPNEFDEGSRAGTDLDLHFVHPYAGGQDLDQDGKPDGYFDDPFDCFWFNPHPDWGTVDPNVDDNPGLDRDDTDGAGPENMNLNVPESGMDYKVGVHYWQDPASPDFPNGYGPSQATIRIFVFGTEVWFKENVQLNEKDMWEVCTISWPSQAVKPIFGNGPGGLKIIPNYTNPFFLP